MEKTIKFYANYKNKKYFISGKNEKNKYYSLWKNPAFENEMYLDTDKFKKGLEIEKSKLKLLEREDGEESKVLVFKNLEDEKEVCISKEEIEKRKKQKASGVSSGVCEYVLDLFRDLFKANESLVIGEKLKSELETQNAPADATEIEDDDLPF